MRVDKFIFFSHIYPQQNLNNNSIIYVIYLANSILFDSFAWLRIKLLFLTYYFFIENIDLIPLVPNLLIILLKLSDKASIQGEEGTPISN